MIELSEFLTAVQDPNVLGKHLNPEQRACVEQNCDRPLMIVAGPGSGKTTVLVLRALRHVLVDGLLPESILLTTFTKKAAAELRERLIGWGVVLVEYFALIAETKSNMDLAEKLKSLDINSFQTGTLDSFLQNWLRATKEVGQPNVIMLEQFAAQYIYRRRIFAPTYREQEIPLSGKSHKEIIDSHLAPYTSRRLAPRNQGEAAIKSFELCGRLIQDLVQTQSYAQTATNSTTQAQHGQNVQVRLLEEYKAYLSKELLVDFSMCAERILAAARAGHLYPNPAIPTIRALLIDEYQDTNPMQEAIYFELSRLSKASLTVVGDDDQALYRFRGATVELFTNFAQRFAQFTGLGAPDLIYLMTNYRSTPEIVSFFNNFSTFDPQFQSARVVGKPPVGPHHPVSGLPVLGLFRSTQEDLAEAIADMMEAIFVGPGYVVPGTDKVVKRDEARGALGDALYLASTVRELKDDDSQTPRLPKLLRDQLDTRNLGVFNPRGQDLRDLPLVQVLLGLIAECVDPGAAREASLYVSLKAKDFVSTWRQQAVAFILTTPEPVSNGGLGKFVSDWKKRKAGKTKWPEEWPVLDLVYKLIAWIPQFRSDPEHQIYLEAITRGIVQATNFSKYRMNVIHEVPPAFDNSNSHESRSLDAIFRDLLIPIAENEIDVDEELLFSFPRNRLNIMTIHQAKGLEYPVVIVDVGSDFKTNHAMQAFKRFPSEPSPQAEMEDHLANHTPIGPLRLARNALDRTFDDIMRLYYVAYSRPQHVLVLVGLDKSAAYGSNIANLAMFWRRDRSWAWRNENPPLKKSTPAMPQSMPLQLI